MAIWAKIDENNLVIQVTEVDDNSADGGHQWLVDNFEGTWLETSYDTRGGVHYTNEEQSEDQSRALRFNYAGIGYAYDSTRNAFIPPAPYPSWVLDETTCLWGPPVPVPAEGSNPIEWDEDSVSWVEVPVDAVE